MISLTNPRHYSFCNRLKPKSLFFLTTLPFQALPSVTKTKLNRMNTRIPKNLDDEEVIEGIMIGGTRENLAIEALYEQNKGLIISFLKGRTNNETAKKPEDILWEAMEALVTNIKFGKYQPQTGIGLAGYFKSICKNLLFKNIESENSRVNRQSIYAGLDSENVPDVTLEMIEKETWDKYVSLFEKAGKNCRRILEMSFADGMKIHEVAQELIREGIYNNEQTVRNAKSKCLKKMKAIMS